MKFLFHCILFTRGLHDVSQTVEQKESELCVSAHSKLWTQVASWAPTQVMTAFQRLYNAAVETHQKLDSNRCIWLCQQALELHHLHPCCAAGDFFFCMLGRPIPQEQLFLCLEWRSLNLPPPLHAFLHDFPCAEEVSMCLRLLSSEQLLIQNVEAAMEAACEAEEVKLIHALTLPQPIPENDIVTSPIFSSSVGPCCSFSEVSPVWGLVSVSGVPLHPRPRVAFEDFVQDGHACQVPNYCTTTQNPEQSLLFQGSVSRKRGCSSPSLPLSLH